MQVPGYFATNPLGSLFLRSKPATERFLFNFSWSNLVIIFLSFGVLVGVKDHLRLYSLAGPRPPFQHVNVLCSIVFATGPPLGGYYVGTTVTHLTVKRLGVTRSRSPKISELSIPLRQYPSGLAALVPTCRVVPNAIYLVSLRGYCRLHFG